MRYLFLIILLPILFLLAGVAQAGTPILDGVETLKYRDDKNDIEPKKSGSGFINTIAVGYNVPINEHVSVYVRFGIQFLSKKDFGRDFADYQRQRKFVAQLDQFCLMYSNAGYTYKLGRQGAMVGVTGLLYDNTKSIGRYSFVDGISMETNKRGNYLKVIVAQEDNKEVADNRIYSITYLHQYSPRLVAGGTLARYDFADLKPDVNYYAIYSSYEVNKFFLYAEHSQAPSKTDMTAHNLGACYRLDPSNQFYVITHKTEPNADMNEKTAFEHNEKGYYYGFAHSFGAENRMDLMYKDNQQYLTNMNHSSIQLMFSHMF